MPISGNIFDGPKPKQTTSDDVVGRFRSGFQANNRPVALDAWRVTTADPEVAEKVAVILGAEDGVSEWETQTGEIYQVFGSAPKVEVILDHVRTSLVLWSNKGGKILESDGEYLIEDGQVTSRPDPDAGLPLAERKEKARLGTGPGPSLQAYFHLASDPDLGKFKFFSGSWTAMTNFSDAEAALMAADGPLLADLELERVSWTDKATGQERSFVKPVITVKGPAPEDSAF